jgi:hypothetical protein
MRHLPLFALVFAAALIAGALVVVPCCVDPVFDVPPDWKIQREQLRKEARETVARHEALYGDLPVEEWPEERHRLGYRLARRILAEMGEGARGEQP